MKCFLVLFIKMYWFYISDSKWGEMTVSQYTFEGQGLKSLIERIVIHMFALLRVITNIRLCVVYIYKQWSQFWIDNP